MRITIGAAGTRGDIQPMLVVAEAARRRGHHVVFCAPPNFEAWVRRHGFEFHALGDDIQAWLDANRKYLSGNPLRIMRGMLQYIRNELARQFAEFPAPTVGTDVVLFAGLVFAAPAVAELRGVPAMFVAYSTSIIPAPAHPPPMLPWQRLPVWLNRLFWNLSKVGIRFAVGRVMRQGRRDLGLPPREAIQHIYGETPFVLAADETLFPLGETLFPRPSYANFPFYEDPAELDPELDAWLREGEPPVFVGFGSMSSEGTDRVSEMLTRALVGEHKRVLVSAGWGGLGKGALPAGWRVVKEAPHAKLFPRCAVVVHHGGAGTMANCLRAGVPQVLLPLILDQFHHAEQLYRKGLAPAPTPMESVTERQLVEAIRAALAIPEERRREVAERLAKSDGAGEVVRRAEELVASWKRAKGPAHDH